MDRMFTDNGRLSSVDVEEMNRRLCTEIGEKGTALEQE